MNTLNLNMNGPFRLPQSVLLRVTKKTSTLPMTKGRRHVCGICPEPTLS